MSEIVDAVHDLIACAVSHGWNQCRVAEINDGAVRGEIADDSAVLAAEKKLLALIVKHYEKAVSKYAEGDKGPALCSNCVKRTRVTYQYRDLVFKGRTARHVLVGVCDECGETATVTPEFTERLLQGPPDK